MTAEQVAAPPMSRRRALTVLLGTAGAVFVVDHLFKWIVVQRLALNAEVPEHAPITIHYIQNRGAAFGLFPQLQAVFLVVAVLVAAYIIVFGHRFGGGAFTQVTLGAILGGAVANAVDRFTQGYVVDFVDVHVWGIFNVADACIVVGILVAVLTIGRRPRAVRSGADR